LEERKKKVSGYEKNRKRPRERWQSKSNPYKSACRGDSGRKAKNERGEKKIKGKKEHSQGKRKGVFSSLVGKNF